MISFAQLKVGDYFKLRHTDALYHKIKEILSPAGYRQNAKRIKDKVLVFVTPLQIVRRCKHDH